MVLLQGIQICLLNMSGKFVKSNLENFLISKQTISPRPDLEQTIWILFRTEQGSYLALDPKLLKEYLKTSQEIRRFSSIDSKFTSYLQ